MSRASHVFTVDVEDWPQSTLCHELPISNRVVANTHTLLELLAEAGVKATFFILGKVAIAYPNLARDIADAGHEIGTHGYSHKSVESMPFTTFRKELHRSVAILRDQTGQPVKGHRAADFSISSSSLHFLEALIAEGIAYDSSIFPIRHPRYGVPGAWRSPHWIKCASGEMLFEFPLATVRLARMPFPVAGGGYLRIFPYWWTRLALKGIELEGIPASCYMHPYEIDDSELREIPYHVPFLLRLSQGANRRSVRNKLRSLLSDFDFTTMATAYDKLRKQELGLALDLSQTPVTYRPEPHSAATHEAMKNIF